MSSTTEEQIACVKREIAMRERVYPRWVMNKRMTQPTADKEIATMRDILGRLERARKHELSHGTAP